MAEKRSKSILSGLKGMLHRESDSDSPAKLGPAAKRKPDTAKKAATEKPKEQGATPVPEAPDTEAEPKPEKKQAKNKPWYHHRQRW